MEGEALNRVSAFLKAHGSGIEVVSKSRLEQFERVDSAVQRHLAEAREAQEVLRSNHINVSAIAAETDISRKTFYNNELLRLFVEEYADVLKDNNSVDAEVERWKERCEELEQQVQHFLLRDIETENLRHENIRLQVEIQNLEKYNKNLIHQYETAQAEISRLKELVPKATVLTFPQK